MDNPSIIDAGAKSKQERIRNVSEMISAKAAQLGKMDAYKGLSENALNDIAYSEVTAEMMETALTDTDVLSRISSRLQQTDKSLWGKIKDFLKGLVERLKAAYQGMNPDSSIARLARQSIQSSENALNAFADAASDAIVNYNLQGDNASTVNPASSTVNTVDSTSNAVSDTANAQKNAAQGNTEQLVKRTEHGQFVATVSNDILQNTDPAQWNGEAKENAIVAAREALAKLGRMVVYDITDDQFGATAVVSTERMQSGNMPVDGAYKAIATGNVLMEAGENQYSVKVYVGKTQSGENVYFGVSDIRPTQFTVAEGQKNTAQEGVQFMSRNSNDSEIVSIKQQIAEAKDELTQMQSVANVAVQDLSKMTQKQRYDWAVNELKRTGYKVDRPNFGVIEFTPKQINTGMNYLRSAEDVAAFAVLPKVLKQGNIIFENKNHKGRQFATFTISAPVTINGTTGYMAVVVQETSSRHYHTHRIVLPDGSAFKFEMQHPDPSGGFAQNSTRLATNTNAASKDKVSQPDADVKQNIRHSSRMDSTGRELSKGQVEYFANSEVRDEDGNLIPVYHSTYDEFYTFDRSKLGGWTLKNASDAGIAATSLIGHWFSDHDLTDAMGGHAIQTYLNIENPYTVDLDTLAAKISSYAEDPGQMQEDFEYGDYEQVRQAADSFTEWLREEGYDGLIVADTEFGGNSYVVLDSAQAKLTTNKAPTASQDTRFSSRQSQEVKQALEDYRYQRDVEFKAMKAVYDAERSQIEQAHRRKMKALEDSYRGEAAKASEKFVQLMREYEKQGLSRKELEQKLSEQADKLSKAEGNAAYWKRQFNELMADYDASGRSIDRLENKIKKQQQDAKAKVENARPISETFKLPQKVSKTADFVLKPAVILELVT